MVFRHPPRRDRLFQDSHYTSDSFGTAIVPLTRAAAGFIQADTDETNNCTSRHVQDKRPFSAKLY
jgi:hypothetical protein